VGKSGEKRETIFAKANSASPFLPNFFYDILAGPATVHLVGRRVLGSHCQRPAREINSIAVSLACDRPLSIVDVLQESS